MNLDCQSFSRKALPAGKKSDQRYLMKKNEPFVYDGTPKQSPHTWPMDKLRQSRIQQKMSSLLSPVTPKRISNAKSLLLQCLRDSKSDPNSRKRFPVSCSDDGILMDGVLVTSATAKKVTSVVRSQLKKTEFSSPRSQSGRNQDTTRSQNSSSGEGKMLAISPPCTKDVNPSKLNAAAEPFILTPRSSQRLASPIPVQPPPSYGHPYFPYPRSLQGPGLFQTQYPSRSPRPTGYQIPHDFNQSPVRNDLRISLLPTTPLSSNLNTNTSKQPVHTPMSTTPKANLSTSITTHGSRLDSSPSVETVTQKPYLSSPSDELVTMTQTPDSCSPSSDLKTPTHKPEFSPSSAGLETMKTENDRSPSDEFVMMTQTQDLCSPSAELKTPTHKPECSPFPGLETMKTEKDWSPSDDGLPEFTQAQADFIKSQDRVLPDDAFQLYKFRGSRMSCFRHLCT